VVIEAQLDKGRGPVATVLVQRGTLKKGDILVAGGAWGRVRALINDRGEQVEEAGPSAPVEVLGFQEAPAGRRPFAVVESEARAREITDYRQRKLREKTRGAPSRHGARFARTDDDALQESASKEFPILVKGDVQGSVEAIARRVEKLGTDEVRPAIIHSGAGGITESMSAGRICVRSADHRFNVRANKQARDAAQAEGIEIRYYNIIYDLVDDVKAAMSGLLSPNVAKPSLAMPRSWRCSTSPRSARWPVVWLPKARSSVAPACA
jgi:translation initiation factor IF-2